MWPVILQLGPLTIYSYGTMMAIGFLVSGWLTGKEMDRRGLNGELASTMVFWAAVGGIAGSKLWAVIQDWQDLVADPIGMIFSGSGFVWYGGFIGGFLAVSWSIWKHGLPWLKMVDCIAPAMAVGHALGRIGCQLSGDGDWGSVSDVPWAMAYPAAIVGWPYPEGVRVHPTPMYEFFAYMAVFAFLWAIRKRPQPDGTLFWWYLVLGGGARFIIEFWRINPPVAFELSSAQVFSLLLIAIGVWRLIATRGAAPAPTRRVGGAGRAAAASPEMRPPGARSR